jgi:hypothetical protein
LWTLAKGETTSVSEEVQQAERVEARAGYYSPATYASFSSAVNASLEQVKAQVVNSRLAMRKVVGFGAAAKGVVMLHASRITLDYVVDENPLKQGRYIPGSAVAVVPLDVLIAEPEDVAIVIFAWNFADEIIHKIRMYRPLHHDQFILLYGGELTNVAENDYNITLL